MKVLLGTMELRNSEKPDFVQHGGEQMLASNSYPGGNVSIQNFGSTYRDISWDGWFEGTDAMERMYRIGNMRQKGDPIVFATENYTAKVVIAKFYADHRTNLYIPFSISLKRIIQITKDMPDEATDQATRLLVEKQAVDKELKESVSRQMCYVIQNGDTLSKIAKKFYGNANLWDEIYAANRDMLTNGPHLLYCGQELKIP